MGRVYFRNKPETRRVYLPWEIDSNNVDFVEDENERTWFEHRKMTEGDYQKYSDLTSVVKVGDKKKDERAEVDMKLGATRKYLLENLVVAWQVFDENGKQVPCTPANLLKMPPEVVRVWVDDIFEFNKILQQEESNEEDKILTSDGEEVPKV